MLGPVPAGQEPWPEPADADDLRGWHALAEGLAGFVLWDRDFEYEDVAQSLTPTIAAVLHLANVPTGYFTTPAPPAGCVSATRALAYLRRVSEEG
jgi:hypothetical protein